MNDEQRSKQQRLLLTCKPRSRRSLILPGITIF